MQGSRRTFLSCDLVEFIDISADWFNSSTTNFDGIVCTCIVSGRLWVCGKRLLVFEIMNMQGCPRDLLLTPLGVDINDAIM